MKMWWMADRSFQGAELAYVVRRSTSSKGLEQIARAPRPSAPEQAAFSSLSAVDLMKMCSGSGSPPRPNCRCNLEPFNPGIGMFENQAGGLLVLGGEKDVRGGECLHANPCD